MTPLLEFTDYPGLFGPEGDGCLRVAAGEAVVLRGESGAGKSRLLRRILRLDPEDCGRILWHGRVLGELSADEVRARVVLVPQDPPRPPRSAWQLWQRIRAFRCNTRPVPDEARLRAACARLDVVTLLEKPLSEISGGEGRRLWLAMALALERELLLLDEPTSGLDARRSAALWQLVTERLGAGTAAIWVSHEALPEGVRPPCCYEIRVPVSRAEPSPELAR